MTKPLVLYGGTFDPVHEGHLAIGRAVAEAVGAPVCLLPAADPPHRPAPGASAVQRAEMIALAVAGDARLLVDRRELDRVGPSFTVDTLQEVRRERGPAAPIIWVLGVDSMVQLQTWKDWQQLFSLASLLAVQRPSTETDLEWLRRIAPGVHAEVHGRWVDVGSLRDAPSGGYAALPIRPLRSESASAVREAVGAGRSIDHLVPAAVAAYIADRKLYRPVIGHGV